ncbi:hypothetical protein HDU80_002435 [Chytriomyces hyalinus]|nr:hypothetical protein HDU80_002435 [Chytriomyces hyalinus]
MPSTPVLGKIAPVEGSISTSTTPVDITQANPGSVKQVRGRPKKNATTDCSAPPVEPASWTGPQANNAKNKDDIARGWHKIRLTLQLEMEVEYTVEQCKAKVQALRSLFSKLKAEEGQTGNSEKKTKKPECFESMVLYFGSKSGLNSETLGDTEDGATMPQEDVLAKFQTFMAASKNAVAGSSSSTVSSSGSLTEIDSDTDSLDDTVDANKSDSTIGKPPVKRMKLTEKQRADKMMRESIGLPPAAASKQSESKLEKLESKQEKLEPKPKRAKTDVAGALENLGGRIGDSISDISSAIAVSHKADPQFKNLESLLNQQAVSSEENSKQLKAIADSQQESSKHMKAIADSQQETSKHLQSVADSNARVSQLLESFLRNVGNSSKQQLTPVVLSNSLASVCCHHE